MPPIDPLVLPDTSGEALRVVRERLHEPPHGVLPLNSVASKSDVDSCHRQYS